MSPEAILSGAVDARSDLYALGAVAYFLVTGKTVFQGESMVDVCAQHLSAAPTPPSERADTFVPPALEAIILSCLEKKAERRPASAAELARRLRAAGQGLAPFAEDDARTWWLERGRPLIAKLSAQRRTSLRQKDGSNVTMAVAPRPSSGATPAPGD